MSGLGKESGPIRYWVVIGYLGDKQISWCNPAELKTKLSEKSNCGRKTRLSVEGAAGKGGPRISGRDL